MRKNRIVVFFFLIPCLAFASHSKYQGLAYDLLMKQNFTKWQHYSSAVPYVAINGREFPMTLDDFGEVIHNTFAQCEDLDAYANRKGVTEDCEAYIYKGMTEWIAMSKDPAVSDRAWKMGTMYAFNSNSPIPHNNVWDFNGWAAGIRVAKSKGY